MGGLTRGFAATDVGLVRERNEDAFLMLPDRDLYVVADGMGGHQRGDVAANLCVEAIEGWFNGELDIENHEGLVSFIQKESGIRHKGEAELVSAIEFANRLIVDTAQSSDAFQGMGTTVVAAYFHGSTLFVVYSGDSRLYRLRDGRLRQLTRDHSLVNEYLRLQLIQPGDARTFPYRNVIMKALGLKNRADIEFFNRRAKPGDLYLLCSDGLTDLVDDSTIRDFLLDGGSLERRCGLLVEAALESGGYDNVTVLLAEYFER